MTNVIANKANKELTNIKVSVDSKKDELNITIPLKGFSIEDMLNSDINDCTKWTRTGTYDETGVNKKTGAQMVDGNIKVASTNGIISVQNEKFGTLEFQVNAWHNIKKVREKVAFKKQQEEAARIMAEQQAKITNPTPQPQAEVTTGDPKLDLLAKLVTANPQAMAVLSPEDQAKILLALAGAK